MSRGVGEQPADATEEATEAVYQLELTASGRTLDAGSRLTLVETCESAGVEIPTMCRAGVCGTCRTRVANGPVRCDSDILSDQDRSDGYVLACVAFPEGDCAIEA